MVDFDKYESVYWQEVNDNYALVGSPASGAPVYVPPYEPKPGSVYYRHKRRRISDDANRPAD